MKPSKAEEDAVLETLRDMKMGRSTCQCGSGQRSYPQYDADGVLICYTCGVCHQREMGKSKRRR